MSSDSNKKIFKAGDTIVKQGDEGVNAYLIESGLVEILIEKENNLVQHIGTRGEGTIIGEMALVDNKPRTATIKAVEDSVLLEITQDDFERRIANSDPVIQMVTKVIMARYRDMISRAQIFGQSSKTIPTPEELERGLVQKTNAVENIKLSNDLKDALDNDWLDLFYQPIVELGSNQIKGFEALIRWNHPEKGFISPETFIPVAENSDLILDISRWVVLNACRMLQKIKSVHTEHPYFMSVNFSATDFSESNFKSYIQYVLNETELKPEELHLEITERLLMTNPSRARSTLDECRAEGMKVSIDDFGTGYSSLSYLHYFPIDILKIDRSFIKNMTNDNASMELVRSIISLGHNMGMKIIAEGIEEEEQAQMLRGIGCDQAQGFMYAKPMRAEDLMIFVQEKST